MSATGYLDSCGFNPSSGGTGDFVVSAAITGYQTPAGASAVNGKVYSYRAQSSDLSQWEDGFGAYTVSTTTLARTTVTASSTGSKVSFTAPPNVYITALSADLQNASLLASGTVPAARLNGGNQYQFYQADGSLQTQPRKLLNTLVASNSVSLADLSSFGLGFPKYEISFEALTPVTSGTSIFIQVNNGSYQGSGYLGSAQGMYSTASIQSWTSAIPMHYGTLASNLSGEVFVFNPLLTGSPIQWNGRSNCLVAGVNQLNLVGGAYNANGALTGFRVICASGNISTGTVRIYGLL